MCDTSEDESDDSVLFVGEDSGDVVVDENDSDDAIMFIMQSRISFDKEEFQVFWRGYPPEDATWEPEENLTDYKGYKKAIEKFRKEHERRKEAHALFKKQKKAGECVVNKKQKFKDGFDRGLKVERIIGANDCDGQKVYCVKWAGTDEADNIKEERLKQCCPDKLLEYFQSSLTFKGASGEPSTSGKKNKKRSEQVAEGAERKLRDRKFN